MTKTRQRQRKKRRLAERRGQNAQLARKARSEKREYDTAVEAIINARLRRNFGPKAEYAIEEIAQAWDELSAESAFPVASHAENRGDVARLLVEEPSVSRAR
jgi:hypothetical protein